MKQGQADRKGPTGQKVEPKSTAISPAAVSYLGIAKGDHTFQGDIANPNYPNMNLGNGYSPGKSVPGWDGEGPGAGRVVRNSGSQGKY
jgi:hypothetical protein